MGPATLHPMAGQPPIALMAVDGVEVKIIVDGFVDVFIADGPGVERYRASDWGDRESGGLPVIGEQGPTVRVDGTVLVSGQVERSTSFERGFPVHYARAEGGWEPDPMIWDDQNVVINVRGKGLVVVSGCSHAGAVNVLRNAQRLTGEERIAGFVGGLHLTGGLFEPIIGETVAALAEMQVGVVMPAHCTGWQALHALARTMPDAFVQPSVGTSVRWRGETPCEMRR